MKEIFEKIIEKLEEESKEWLDVYEKEHRKGNYDAYADGMNDAFDEAIEIVKHESEQYNNVWIPCSEKLPEVRQDVLVTVKYTGFMGMHGYWIKTGHMEAENDWWGDCAGGEVIAWQPLPKPFQKGDNNENS